MNAAGFKHHRDRVLAGFVQPAHEFRLVIGLANVDIQTEGVTGLLAGLLNVGQGGRAVHLRLARAKSAQIRAVQDPHQTLASLTAPPPHMLLTAARDLDHPAGSGEPRSSRTTKRSTSPRVFLSTCIVSRSSGQASAR